MNISSFLGQTVFVPEKEEFYYGNLIRYLYAYSRFVGFCFMEGISFQCPT